MQDEARRASADGAEDPFHAGETALQREAQVAERMARLGGQVIRSHMPEQHRAFFPLLPFIVVGSVNELAQPVASLLAAPPGFVTSPDEHTLRVAALPPSDDPFERALRTGASLGVLGIQAQTRRRNRVNGIVVSRDARGFTLAVRQSFGNCPKYITPREAIYVGSAAPPEVRVSERLDARQRVLMAAADTFYIATAHPEATVSATSGRARPDEPEARSHGVDVSHRGGPPGFIHFTSEDTFIIPDFRGNYFFNTLGNLRLYDAAGLLFLDIRQGDLLQVQASAEVLAGAHPLSRPENSGRVVRFRVHGVRFFPRAAPLRFLPGPVSV